MSDPKITFEIFRNDIYDLTYYKLRFETNLKQGIIVSITDELLRELESKGLKGFELEGRVAKAASKHLCFMTEASGYPVYSLSSWMLRECEDIAEYNSTEKEILYDIIHGKL